MKKDWEGEERGASYSGEGEVIKDLRAVLPRVGVAVLLLAFVVEAVHLGDLPALVIAPQQRDLVRPPSKTTHVCMC